MTIEEVLVSIDESLKKISKSLALLEKYKRPLKRKPIRAYEFSRGRKL